jgi:subtilase family serine protease
MMRFKSFFVSALGCVSVLLIAGLFFGASNAYAVDFEAVDLKFIQTGADKAIVKATVKNNGDTTIYTLPYALVINKWTDSESIAVDIAPGATTTIDLSQAFSDYYGLNIAGKNLQRPIALTMKFELDPGNMVDESNEGNNRMVKTFHLK